MTAATLNELLEMIFFSQIRNVSHSLAVKIMHNYENICVTQFYSTFNVFVCFDQNTLMLPDLFFCELIRKCQVCYSVQFQSMTWEYIRNYHDMAITYSIDGWLEIISVGN